MDTKIVNYVEELSLDGLSVEQLRYNTIRVLLVTAKLSKDKILQQLRYKEGQGITFYGKGWIYRGSYFIYNVITSVTNHCIKVWKDYGFKKYKARLFIEKPNPIDNYDNKHQVLLVLEMFDEKCDYDNQLNLIKDILKVVKPHTPVVGSLITDLSDIVIDTEPLKDTKTVKDLVECKIYDDGLRDLERCVFTLWGEDTGLKKIYLLETNRVINYKPNTFEGYQPHGVYTMCLTNEIDGRKIYFQVYDRVYKTHNIDDIYEFAQYIHKNVLPDTN